MIAVEDNDGSSGGAVDQGGPVATMVAVALGLMVLVMVVVAITGGDDEATPPSTVADSTIPETTFAPPTTAITTTTVGVTTTLATTATIDSRWSLESTAWFVDTSRRLVIIDMPSGDVQRHDVGDAFVTDMAVVGSEVLLVATPAESMLVRPDGTISQTILGEPIAWDAEVVWTSEVGDDGQRQFIAHRPGLEPTTVLGPFGELTTVHAVGGWLYIDGPNGVWRLHPDGAVEDVEQLAITGRGAVTVAHSCESVICHPEVTHDDGRKFATPADTESVTIKASWSGDYVFGGLLEDAWILNTITGELGIFPLPRDEVEWGVGVDWLTVLRGNEMSVVDALALPDGPGGGAWTHVLPIEIRPSPFLLVADSWWPTEPEA